LTLPISLRSLTIGNSFNHSLARVTLPLSLQTLTMGDTFKRVLQGVMLPRNLQTLSSFGEYVNTSLAGVLRNLQTLTFGYWFNNKSVAGVILPTSLRTLTLGDSFNQSKFGRGETAE
jgi:hypothetical protein